MKHKVAIRRSEWSMTGSCLWHVLSKRSQASHNVSVTIGNSFKIKLQSNANLYWWVIFTLGYKLPGSDEKCKKKKPQLLNFIESQSTLKSSSQTLIWNSNPFHPITVSSNSYLALFKDLQRWRTMSWGFQVSPHIEQNLSHNFHPIFFHLG